jgi:hypothetical protein
MQAMDPRLRFLVVSGKLISAEEQMALARLGVYFCPKPFRNEDLLQAVTDAARSTGAAAVAQVANLRHEPAQPEVAYA